MDHTRKPIINNTELEKRQEKLLIQLDLLAEEIKKLKEKMVQTHGTIQDTGNCTTERIDVVIYANPTNPLPLSLRLAFESLKERLPIRTLCHIHSSVRNAPQPSLLKFLGEQEVNEETHQMSITLIWKEQDKVTMMVKPIKQNEIQHEVNVFRYLMAVCPSSRGPKDEDAQQLTEADAWLDLVHFSILNGNSKERQSAIKALNSHFGKAEFVVGDTLSYADLFAWSALARKGGDSHPTNVKKWMKTCESYPIFKSAIKYLSLLSD